MCVWVCVGADVCMWVCVCVCEKERGYVRVRERVRERVRACLCLCMCVNFRLSRLLTCRFPRSQTHILPLVRSLSLTLSLSPSGSLSHLCERLRVGVFLRAYVYCVYT